MNFIDETATMGKDVTVWHFARVLKGAHLSAGVSVGSGAEIGAGSYVGERSRIGAGVFLPPNSYVGSDVFIGPNATFTDDKYPRAGNIGYLAQPPYIHNGASVGAGAVILPGVTIGPNAVIGAGCVVAHSVPENHIIYSIQNICLKKKNP